MKIFLSWSGDESRQVAEALRDWLPVVSESIDPYLSARDNEAGVRWGDIVATQLSATDFGILCCTRSNLTAPWLVFEAGAIGKAVNFARVVPLLHGVAISELQSPLSQFMAKKDDRAGVLDLVRTINAGLERPRSDAALDVLFNAVWPGLEATLTAIVPHEPAPAPTRTERDILEEILQLVRAQNSPPPRPPRLLTSKSDLGRARVLEAAIARRATSEAAQDDIANRLRVDLAEIDPDLRLRLDLASETLSLFVDAHIAPEAREKAIDEMQSAASILGLQLRVRDEVVRD